MAALHLCIGGMHCCLRLTRRMFFPAGKLKRPVTILAIAPGRDTASVRMPVSCDMRMPKRTRTPRRSPLPRSSVSYTCMVLAHQRHTGHNWISHTGHTCSPRKRSFVGRSIPAITQFQSFPQTVRMRSTAQPAQSILCISSRIAQTPPRCTWKALQPGRHTSPAGS